MPSAFEFEFADPTLYHCDCCGGLTVRLTRYVYRNGDAFAVYYATYSNSHDAAEVSCLVSLGEWGDGSVASNRVAFYCRVRPTADSYEVMLDDASQSPWAEADILGAKLTRDDARRHEWKKAAFEVLDEAFLSDPVLRGYLVRADCGDTNVPLEQSFQAPDVIFSLSGDERSRANAGENFAVLDGSRHFVRSLFSITVDGYETWSIGLWVEVSRVDHDQLVSAWDDLPRYAKLRFAGRVANDVSSVLGLPIVSGSDVMLHVPDPNAPPQVESSPDPDLAGLLSRPWPRSEFETFAVARGFL